MSSVASGQITQYQNRSCSSILAEGATATEEQLVGGVGETRLTAHGQPSGLRRSCEGCSAVESLIRVFLQSSLQQVVVNRLHAVSAYRSISLDAGIIEVCL